MGEQRVPLWIFTTRRRRKEVLETSWEPINRGLRGARGLNVTDQNKIDTDDGTAEQVFLIRVDPRNPQFDFLESTRGRNTEQRYGICSALPTKCVLPTKQNGCPPIHREGEVLLGLSLSYQFFSLSLCR